MTNLFFKRRFNHQNGFTLIELLILIAIIGIVVAASAPSMRSMIDNNRVSSYVNSLVGAAHLAKSEAVFRNKPVTLCVTACGGDDGWAVSDSSGVLKSGGQMSDRIELSGEQNVVFTEEGAVLSGMELTVSLGDAKPRIVKIGAAGSITSSVIQEQAE